MISVIILIWAILLQNERKYSHAVTWMTLTFTSNLKTHQKRVGMLMFNSVYANYLVYLQRNRLIFFLKVQ